MITSFSCLETAKSGLTTSQAALSVTSKNVTNASTDGYTRESAVITSTTTGNGQTKFNSRNSVSSGGATVSMVKQYRDTYLDSSYRSENSLLSKWDGLSGSLSEIEDVFNELSDSSSDDLTGVSGQLDDLISSFRSLQNNSKNTTLAGTVQSDASTLCQMINYDATKLNDILSNTKADLAITVTGSTDDSSGSGGANAIINNLSSLNAQIASYVASGKNTNDLLDERNSLLDKLSGYFSISVSQQDNGMVTVGLADDTSGNMLIDKDNNVTELKMNSDNTAVMWNDGDGDDTNDVEATITAGTVGADLEIINGESSSDLGIPYMFSKLNAFASSFADAVNNVGKSYNSSAADLISYDSSNAASSIKISDEWDDDSTLILDNYTGSDSASYVGSFVDLFSKDDLVTFNSNAYNGTLSDFADSLSLDVGDRLKYADTMGTSAQTSLDDLDTQRQSVSSVSIDDEGVNILKYEQAYNASARVITAINDMLETLIKETAV